MLSERPEAAGHGWEFYGCSIDDDEGIVAVDIGIHERAPLLGCPWECYITVPILDPMENGLLRPEEMPALQAIQTQLFSSFDRRGGHYVGRGTSSGSVRHLLYVPSRELGGEAVAEVRAALTDRDIGFTFRHDPGWLRYFLIYPNELAWQFIEDRKLLEVMEANGDPLEVPRRIVHHAFFPRPSARERFVQRVTHMGYLVEDLQALPASDGLGKVFQVVFTHVRQPLGIFPVTERLSIVASELGGSYDGWEAELLGSAPGGSMRAAVGRSAGLPPAPATGSQGALAAFRSRVAGGPGGARS